MTGRNDPCPCGSGKKYKKCCLGKQTFMESMGTPNAATEVLNQLKAHLGEEPLSAEELNARASLFMTQQNHTPKEDFLGLSSGQMHHILHSSPFTSEDILSLKNEKELNTALLTQVPVLKQTLYLLEELGKNEKGVKATQTGNLPRALVQDYFTRFRDDLSSYLRKPMSQTDVGSLDLLVFALKEIRLIKIRTGWISLTKTGRELAAPENLSILYCRLFHFYAVSLDWLSTTGYGEENVIVQQALSFDLYLLKMKAGKFIHQGDLAGLFQQAFPQAEDAGRVFEYLFLEQFCQSFGLTDREKTGKEKGIFQEYRYRRSELFEHVFEWNI